MPPRTSQPTPSPTAEQRKLDTQLNSVTTSFALFSWESCLAIMILSEKNLKLNVFVFLYALLWVGKFNDACVQIVQSKRTQTPISRVPGSCLWVKVVRTMYGGHRFYADRSGAPSRIGADEISTGMAYKERREGGHACNIAKWKMEICFQDVQI